jgi:hypothetical protein
MKFQSFLTPFFFKKIKVYFVSKQLSNIGEEKKALDTTKASMIEAKYFDITKTPSKDSILKDVVREQYALHNYL